MPNSKNKTKFKKAKLSQNKYLIQQFYMQILSYLKEFKNLLRINFSLKASKKKRRFYNAKELYQTSAKG